MRRVRVLLKRHPLLGLVSVCLGLAVAWIALAETVSSYPPGTVEIGDIYDLEDWFRDQQEKFLPIMPPMDQPFMQTGYPKVLPFDPLEFPKECRGGLVGDIDYGVPVYDLYLVEDPTTRAFIIYNVDYEEVCSLPAPKGYDPAAFAKDKYPDLYSGGYSASHVKWILDLYDPSRIQVSVRLIPTTLFDAYLAEKEEADALVAMSLVSVTMMTSGGGGSQEGLWVSAEAVLNGTADEIDVTVHLPSGFTDRVDIFESEGQPYSGLASEWALAASDLSADGFDSITWTDTDAGNAALKVYTAGSADADSDGDTLADARELLLFKTHPDDSDSDEDGLDDGAEVNIHATDPVNPDSDGDNLLDGAEVNTHGTDPLDADTDGDWASDGFEVQEGTSPTLASETPRLEMHMNDGAYYAMSPDLVLEFPGLVSDSVVVHEVFLLPEQQNGACVVFSEGTSLDGPGNGVLYTLQGNPSPVEDGVHYIEVRAVRGTESGPVYAHSIILDTQAPTLMITSPIDGSTTCGRWIRVAGNATDGMGPVRVYIDGEWADGAAADGFFWLDRFILQEGANTITVVAEDMAGHVAEQQVIVHQDLQSDTDPPVLDLLYSSTGTPVGDIETLALHGTIDDVTAAVEFTVTADGVTSGPHFVNVIDGKIWGSIPLSPGENTVEVVAVDASGNQSAHQFTVLRDPGTTLEITYPSAGDLVHDIEAVVLVVGSEDKFDNAAVEVNGVPTQIKGTSDGLITFETVNPVSLDPFLTPLEAKATDPDTGDWYDKLTAQGYEIFSYGATNRGSSAGMTTGEPCWWTNWMDPNETRAHWSADERPLNFHVRRYEESMSCTRLCTCSTTTGLQYELDHLDLAPPGSALFEDVMQLHDFSDPAEDYVEVQRGVIESDARYTFRKYVEGVDKQLIVLHFHNMDYTGRDDPLDPSLITFRGEPGFAYGEDGVGFLQEIKIDATNSISKADLQWPSFCHKGLPDQQEWGRRLSFNEWGNRVAEVALSFRAGDDEELSEGNDAELSHGTTLGRINPENDPSVLKAFSNNMEIRGTISEAIPGASYNFRRTVEYQRIDDGQETAYGRKDDDTEGDHDEELDPEDGFIHSIDCVALIQASLFGQTTEYRANFEEWVEVSSATVSRASVSKKLKWHSVTTVVRQADGSYVRSGANEIGEGHVKITRPGAQP